VSLDREGNIRELFDDIVERTSAVLLTAAQRVLGDGHHAEDVVQDSYVRLYRTMKKGELVQSPEAWLRKVVTDGALNCRKRERIRSWQPLWEGLLDGQAVPAEQALAAGEQKNRIDGAVDDLPEQERRAFIMHVVVNMSPGEIGEALGCSPDTARKHVRAAHARLIAAFRPYLEEK